MSYQCKPRNKLFKSHVYYQEDKRYRGEVIVDRRNTIDFTLSLGHISQSITSKIKDKSNYDERIKHYNLKLKLAFERLGYGNNK